MPPKKRARAASPIAGDSPPAKRQTRSRNAKGADVDADTTAGADKPVAAPKKVTRAKKPKPDIINDEDAEALDSPADVVTSKEPAQPKGTFLGDGELEVGRAQIATDKKLRIPVDEHCPLSSYHVYIDPDDSIIYDASLNQTNASNNNNKFYRLQLLVNATGQYQTWTRWGRVGDRGQSKVLGNGNLASAMSEYEKKFKDKAGLKWEDRGLPPKSGKYVFLERSYEAEEKPRAKADSTRGRSKSPPKCTLDPPVRSLMELIFNEEYFSAVMKDLNYDVAKMPLGRLGKATIYRGFQALKDLSALLEASSNAAVTRDSETAADIEQLSNLYYSLIPHAFGRNHPPVIRTDGMVQQEVQLLESLVEMKDGDNVIKKEEDVQEVHPLDFRFNSLRTDMTALQTGSTEFKEISQYLINTRGHTHGFDYKVEDIFRIERKGEFDRFDQYDMLGVGSHRKLLWHGSRTTNYGGILSQGLRIAPPEAPVNGYMFDKGIYLADMSSKSAGYCHSYLSGDVGVLMLCEAELGDPTQILQDADYDAGAKARAQGVYSTHGQGLTGPQAWKDAGCVHPSLAGVEMPDTSKPPGPTGVANAYLEYNEYVAYDISQVRLRYLLRVRM
ncbi:hypothetical protein LTR22_012913 [Elasticomyces elasticus]|nr:hypothetical protein LTR22_012913 [Elasticomyces elasticus]